MSWQGSRTGHTMQSWRALASRRARASGRSPGAAKNRSVCPLQEAIDCQAAPRVGASRRSMTISEASDADTERAFPRERRSQTSTIVPRRQKSTQCVSPIGTIGYSDNEVTLLPGGSEPLAGGPVGPSLHRLPLATRVPGDAADRHLDAETGGSTLFLGLAAPEAVLTVVAGPAPARPTSPGRRGRSSGLWPRGPRVPRGVRREGQRRRRVCP